MDEQNVRLFGIKSPDEVKNVLKQQFELQEKSEESLNNNPELLPLSRAIDPGLAEAQALEKKVVSLLEDEYRKEQLQRLKDDNAGRKRLRVSIFILTIIWMLLVLVIVILTAVKIFVLSDTVLIALITTTTANVFGFFYVVVNYLFNKEKST